MFCLNIKKCERQQTLYCIIVVLAVVMVKNCSIGSVLGGDGDGGVSDGDVDNALVGFDDGGIDIGDCDGGVNDASFGDNGDGDGSGTGGGEEKVCTESGLALASTQQNFKQANPFTENLNCKEIDCDWRKTLTSHTNQPPKSKIDNPEMWRCLLTAQQIELCAKQMK